MALRALYDVPAPAKLNLFLHVVGRRDDGYHLLQSPFVLIDWADVLHFERRDDGRLVRRDLGETLPADDLCLRAARALQQASACALGVEISIDKRVPSGAGMGGGSSDAATVLLALNRLWGLDWPRARLAEIGLRLGADVPFFVGGTNAFVEGIGERLTRIALAPAAYAVVKPSASLPTADIFRHPLMRRDTERVILTGSFDDAGCMGAPAAWEADRRDGEGIFGRNDLQPAAEDRCPEVAQAARWLQSRFGHGRMTGSGSAVFARVGLADAPEARAAAMLLDELPAHWVGRICRGLSVHPLAGWAG